MLIVKFGPWRGRTFPAGSCGFGAVLGDPFADSSDRGCLHLGQHLCQRAVDDVDLKDHMHGLSAKGAAPGRAFGRFGHPGTSRSSTARQHQVYAHALRPGCHRTTDIAPTQIESRQKPHPTHRLPPIAGQPDDGLKGHLRTGGMLGPAAGPGWSCRVGPLAFVGPPDGLNQRAGLTTELDHELAGVAGSDVQALTQRLLGNRPLMVLPMQRILDAPAEANPAHIPAGRDPDPRRPEPHPACSEPQPPTPPVTRYRYARLPLFVGSCDRTSPGANGTAPRH